MRNSIQRLPRTTHDDKDIYDTHGICIRLSLRPPPGYVTLVFDSIVFNEFPRVFNARLGIIIGTGSFEARLEEKF